LTKTIGDVPHARYNAGMGTSDMKLGIITGMHFEADILRDAAQGIAEAQRPIIQCHGLGRAAAFTATEDAIDRGAQALLSFGIAGGLDPDLLPGDIITPTYIRDGAKALFSDAAWTARLQRETGSRAAPMAHASAVIMTRADKAQAFAATQGVATDMESYGVGEAALAHNLPFAVLRVIADTAWDPLPSAAVAAARTDGSINVMKSVFGAITRPWQIPALVRLGTRTNRARKTLRTLADLGLARSFFV
jgi:adenosylhomocysteine nucleosidase